MITTNMAINTLYDYYTSKGQVLPSDRSSIATKAGITNYTGSADQNTTLLKYLQSSGGSTPVTTKTPTTALPQKNINQMSVEEATTSLKSAGLWNPPTPATSPVTSSSTPVRTTATDAGVDLGTTKAQTFEEFKTETQKNLPPAPSTPNLTDIYTTQRANLGVPALEDNINALDAEKANLEAELTKFKQQETTGQSASFAAGRVSTAQQNIQDKIDAINRDQTVAINKLNTANTFIQNLMGFTQQDYATANSNYQFEFNKNIQLQNAYTSQESKQTNDARATLTTFTNLISNSGGTFDYSSLSDTMKSQINQQELQAGLPIGTIETFARTKPKSNMISNGTGYDASGNQFAWIVSQDSETGTPTISQMFTGGVASKTIPGDNGGTNLTSEQLKQEINKVISTLEFQELSDEDKVLYIQSQGGTPSDYGY